MTFSYPTGQGQPLGYVQLTDYAANVITAASWSGGKVSYTTTTSHSVPVGATFTISGMTPAGYNGTFVAVAGTTGSTLVADMVNDPGTASVMGTLVASLSVATKLPVPAGATRAVIAVGGAGVRYRDDSVAPTATVGLPLAQNEVITYAGPLRSVQFIAQTGSPILDILFYK